MNNSGVIETSKNPDLVTFTVLVDGSAIPGTVQVLSAAVTKEVNRVPVATIVIADGEAPSKDFPLSNEATFLPGKEVEITAGYHSDEEAIFKGIIIKHSLKVSSGISMLVLECKDACVKMTVGRKSKYFYESKDSEIFEEIIDTYGIDKDVEATNYSHPELVQYNASDWDFVVARAQANGKLCFPDDGKLTIAKPDFGQDEIETVTFGTTMLDFDAEMDARTQIAAITASSWNYGDQEILETDGSDPGVTLNGNFF